MNTEVNGKINARQLILKSLSQRERVNSVTDLGQLYRQMRGQTNAIHNDDVISVFKDLQDKGAGSLVFGRNGNPTRFIWRYNLKQVAERALMGFYRFKELPLLEEVSRARIVDPVTKRVKRKTVQELSVIKPKRKYSPRRKKLTAAPLERETVVKAIPNVIQLNLEVPASWTKDDMQALLNLLAEPKKSTAG